MEGNRLTGSAGFPFTICDESGTPSHKRGAMRLCHCCFPEPGLIYVHPGREATCGISYCPGTISRLWISSKDVVGNGVAAVVSVWSFTTTWTFSSAVPYVLSVSLKYSTASPHPGCVRLSSHIYICQKLLMQCCTVLDIVLITQPRSSSSFSLPCSVSSSSSSSSSWSSCSSSPSSYSSELAWSLRLSPITFHISSMVSSGFLVVHCAFSAVLISSCACIIAVSASWTRFLATVVSLFTKSLIHFSFSSLLEKCIARHFTTESVIFHRKWRNAPTARTLSASKPLLSLYAWWHRCANCSVDLPYLLAGSGQTFFLRALTILSCVDLVVGWDVGCCKIWTTLRQAASFMSRLVGLFNLNKEKSMFWPSLHWESSC